MPFVAETDLYETDKEVQNLIDRVCLSEQIIGESAGAILLAPDIEYAKDTDNPLVASQLKTFEALKIIDFYPVPHYKDDSLKDAVELTISKYGTELPLVPFSNSQAILVKGKERQVVSKKVASSCDFELT